jgi:hypothetical protein
MTIATTGALKEATLANVSTLIDVATHLALATLPDKGAMADR